MCYRLPSHVHIKFSRTGSWLKKNMRGYLHANQAYLTQETLRMEIEIFNTIFTVNFQSSFVFKLNAFFIVFASSTCVNDYRVDIHCHHCEWCRAIKNKVEMYFSCNRTELLIHNLPHQSWGDDMWCFSLTDRIWSMGGWPSPPQVMDKCANISNIVSS